MAKPKNKKSESVRTFERFTQDALRAKHAWREVPGTKVWRPAEGEDLIGFFKGRRTKKGSFGPYEQIVLQVPYQGVFLISGTMLLNLVDGAALKEGDLVRIVYMGNQGLGYDETGKEKKMKTFQLLVPEPQPDQTKMADFEAVEIKP